MYGRSLAREECTDNTTVTPVTDLNNTFTGSTESYNTLNSTLSAAGNNLLITKGSGNVVFGANRSFTITQSGSNHALTFNMVNLATNGVNVLCKIDGNTVATISTTGISNLNLSTLATGNHTISFETASSVSGSNRTFTIDDVEITYDVTSVTTTCNPMLSIAEYKYGFNGQERDNEVSGKGNSYTAEFWQYDPRLGRRWNLDPVVKSFLSSYSVFSDNPIIFVDPNGDDDYFSADGKFLRRDNKKTNFVFVQIKGNNYPLTDLQIPFKKSKGHISQDALLKIVNHYSVEHKANRVEEGVNVMQNYESDNISVHVKWDFKTGGYKIHKILNTGNNIQNVFEHEEGHISDRKSGILKKLNRVDSELRSVMKQIQSESWENTTKDFKEYLYDQYAGYFLTPTGKKYKDEFEKHTGIEISKEGEYAKWEYTNKKKD